MLEPAPLSPAPKPIDRMSELRRKRSLAKAGMTASLGLLTATGVMEGLGSRGPMVRTCHIASGFALIGFSLWHYSLYNRKTGRA